MQNWIKDKTPLRSQAASFIRGVRTGGGRGPCFYPPCRGGPTIRGGPPRVPMFKMPMGGAALPHYHEPETAQRVPAQKQHHKKLRDFESGTHHDPELRRSTKDPPRAKHRLQNDPRLAPETTGESGRAPDGKKI